MYFPIAQSGMSSLTLLGVGFVAGVMSGIFGIGGGIVSTPFLINIGINPLFAVAASAHQIIGASFSGLISRLFRGMKDRDVALVDFKLGGMMSVFGFLGSWSGLQISRILQESGNGEFLISMSYLVVLGGVGMFMMCESFLKIRKVGKPQFVSYEDQKTSLNSYLPLQIYFGSSGISASLILIFVVGFVSGMVISIMGIGGGFIIVPALFYLVGVGQGIATGTSLLQIFIITSQVTFVNIVYYGSLDIVMSCLLMVGSVLGSQIGTVLSFKIRPDVARLMLALLIIFIAGSFGYNVFVEPSSVFDVKMM